MATESVQSLAWSTLNKIELDVVEALLYYAADLIDALMVEGIPYTKVYLGGQGGQ